MKIPPLHSSALTALALMATPAQSQMTYGVEFNYERVNPSLTLQPIDANRNAFDLPDGRNRSTSDTFHDVSHHENPSPDIPNQMSSVPTVDWTNQNITPVSQTSLSVLLGLGAFGLILRKRSL